mmetsp:Transcript_25257/g.39420  ORF Transcript_25257/g.39420 Transcript_25257/m.39420 type:complete len:531 (-) Transcript_25257:71-1663(-)
MDDFAPHNPLASPLMTDMYQLTMAYAYFRGGRHNDHAVFDLFFRKNPFEGEYAVFAGLEEVLRFLNGYKFTQTDVDYVRTIIPGASQEFCDWLLHVDCSKVKVYALKEGTVCFPRVPLLRVEGPIAICQLLETPLLVLVNYATLVATNAARHRRAAGPGKQLLEFGLRRAQGPDGGLSASRYCYLGGFDGSSNVLAGKIFNVTPKGTMAHSFVTSYRPEDELPACSRMVNETDLLELALKYREGMASKETQNVGELKSFVSYAASYPSSTLCLVDSYNTLNSGVPNFLCVALALHDAGQKAVGIRLDSGDLAYLSRQARKLFTDCGEKHGVDYFKKLTIVASNDLKETTILSLNQQGHEIDVFAIGTHLVTCKSQPALGGVYKLVEVNGEARIKLSEEFEKVTIPGKKDAYRLYAGGGCPVIDLMRKGGSPAPEAGQKLLCQHPFIERKRAYVVPKKVVPLHHLAWDGKVVIDPPSVEEIRQYVADQLENTRPDHLRHDNPTPYKVSVDVELYGFLRQIWLNESPIPQLE